MKEKQLPQAWNIAEITRKNYEEPSTWVHLPQHQWCCHKSKNRDLFWGVSTLWKHGNFKEDIFVTKDITRDGFYSIYWISGTVFKILHLSIIPKFCGAEWAFQRLSKPNDESLEPHVAFSRREVLQNGHISKQGLVRCETPSDSFSVKCVFRTESYRRLWFP